MALRAVGKQGPDGDPLSDEVVEIQRVVFREQFEAVVEGPGDRFVAIIDLSNRTSSPRGVEMAIRRFC